LIYALCDEDMLNRYNSNHEEFVSLAKDAGCSILQYRAKNLSINQAKINLIKIRQIWSGYLIINDYIELSNFCDGVHIGQEDLINIDTNKKIALEKLRQKIGKDKLLGLSTHNQYEVEEANKFNIDYIGLGAFRETSTKNVSDSLGDKLDKIAKLSSHKVAAIGGVRFSDNFKNVTYKLIGSGFYAD